jgi:hypothetical protein
MTTFTVYALPPAELDRIRAAGRDDFGHPLRISADDDVAGTPLRCCLRDAEVGERVALLSWQPLTEAPDSAYAEVGPIFVHADSCPGYRESAAYPAGFRHRTQLLRSYTAGGDMLDYEITDGAAAEATIEKLLANPDAAVIHSRNVKAGCYMFAIRPTTSRNGGSDAR